MLKPTNETQVIIANLNPSKHEHEGPEKGKWNYNAHFICYGVSAKHKGKKFEVTLNKIQNILESINCSSIHNLNSMNIDNILFLKNLIQIKVTRYNSSHSFFYKLFSRILYGNVQTYEKSIMHSIDSIVEKIKEKAKINNEPVEIILNHENTLNQATNYPINPVEISKEELLNEKNIGPSRVSIFYEKDTDAFIEDPVVSEKPIIQPSNQPQATILFHEKESFINEFVHAFLSPYIEGKINAETEDPKRQPMIEQLFIQLEKKLNKPLSSEQKKEVEELALKAYLKLGIHGAYRRLHFDREWTRFNNNDNYFEALGLNEINNILTPALEQALKKDFPHQQFTKEELKKKIAEAGARYNEETDEILQKKAQILEDNPSIGNIDDRYSKLNLLMEQKQEPSAKHFLDNSSLSKEQVEVIERKNKEEMRQKLKHRSESDSV